MSTILKVPGQGNQKKKKIKVGEVTERKPRGPRLIRSEYLNPDTGRTVVRWGPPPMESKRSDLGKPYVIGDNVEYISTVTGKPITSKREHRDELRAHDLVEVGNENMPELNAKKRAAEAREFKQARVKDIVESFEKAEQGYQGEDSKALDTADEVFADVSTDSASLQRV